MSSKKSILRFLSGGLGALTMGQGDGPAPVIPEAKDSPSARPEETKPEPAIHQTEPFYRRVLADPQMMVVAAIIGIGLFVAIKK